MPLPKSREVPGSGRAGLQVTPLGIQDTPGVTVSNVALSPPVGETRFGELLPGRVNVVGSSDLDLELQIRAAPLAELVGQRVGLKVTWDSTPPASITVIAPAGTEIEADTGLFGAESELEGQMYGRVYREWICDSAGRWLLVALIEAPAVG